MDLGLKGKVALVTGGSKGIGLATARRLVIEGAKVAIAARTESVLQAAAEAIRTETGGEVLAVVADVSSAAACREMVQTVLAHFGRLDILVNNAGSGAAKVFDAVDDDAWRYDLDSKLSAAIWSARAAIPHMRAVGGGSILNVTAISGKAPKAGTLPTSVSRAAGLALTKAMSKDLAKDQIRVNAVCIGLVRSEQQERKWQSAEPESSWEEWAAKRAEAVGIPLGRIGDAEEAANVITFLVSDGASYISGTAVNIDGALAATL